MKDKKQFSDLMQQFFERNYAYCDEPKTLIGRIHYILFGNLMSVILWSCIGLVTGFLLLLMLIDLVVWLVRGKTFFGLDEMGVGGG